MRDFRTPVTSSASVLHAPAARVGTATNEIPLGRRTRAYRLFEMLPALVSGTLLLAVFVLPFLDPRWGAYYVLAVVLVMFVRGLRGAVDLTRGHLRYRAACRVDWRARLEDIRWAAAGRRDRPAPPHAFRQDHHRQVLARVRQGSGEVLDPETVHHAIVLAAYREPYEVIEPTVRALVNSTTPGERMILFFAYEERGGDPIRETVHRLKAEYGHRFAAFEPVMHPADLPDELAGKGANITFAARRLSTWVRDHGLDSARVLVTSLDCDNRPHESYFDNVAYEFVTRPDRSRLSFQPVSLYLNNIWDAPAITRVVAASNCFWNLTVSVRPNALRNFASHTQPLDALESMDYWSVRTIVEDGHQYWRSWFHFRGDYGVVPIHVPIGQDAVLAGTLRPTLVAQYKQLSRWSYGASDVPFVATNVLRHAVTARGIRWRFLLAGLYRLWFLLDGHVTQASVPFVIAFGGWVPFLAMKGTGEFDALASEMPFLVGAVQQVAMISLFVSILVYRDLLPPRPVHHPRSRHPFMYLQWLLYPLTIMGFQGTSAVYSQARLLLGRYRETFAVTEKVAADHAPAHGPDLRDAVPREARTVA
ncbi:hypothetical protein [Brevibacterium litoralis]|uniref:hypothetical protein n=1 Tax=Brevibacterium litoralis TaxID=3138935 RepID=UPI0032EF49B4